MKTDHKFGLGKDRRELSYYQSKDWMNNIKNIEKKFPDRKGMKHPRCKFDDDTIRFIRNSEVSAKEISKQLGMSEGYVYQLRANKRRK